MNLIYIEYDESDHQNYYFLVKDGVLELSSLIADEIDEILKRIRANNFNDSFEFLVIKTSDAEDINLLPFLETHGIFFKSLSCDKVSLLKKLEGEFVNSSDADQKFLSKIKNINYDDIEILLYGNSSVSPVSPDKKHDCNAEIREQEKEIKSFSETENQSVNKRNYDNSETLISRIISEKLRRSNLK